LNVLLNQKWDYMQEITVESYECLRGGLDFTKNDENINSQPFNYRAMHFKSI
jgi:ribulose 1,5-bisphosphate carboxylase large subunit-like protein